MKKLFFAIAIFSTLIVNAQTIVSKSDEKQKPQSHVQQAQPIKTSPPVTTRVESSDGRSITINVSGNVYAPITIVLDRGNANVQPAPVAPEPMYAVPAGHDSIATPSF